MKKIPLPTSIESWHDTKKVIHSIGCFLLLFFFSLISYINWIFLPNIFINFLQIILFYTLIKRPKFLLWSFLFFFSLFQDFFSDLPFGLTAFSCILSIFILLPYNKSLKKISFSSLWIFFIFFSIFNTSCTFFILSYIRSNSFSFFSVFSISSLCTWLIFPAAARFLYISYTMIKKMEHLHEG